MWKIRYNNISMSIADPTYGWRNIVDLFLDYFPQASNAHPYIVGNEIRLIDDIEVQRKEREGMNGKNLVGAAIIFNEKNFPIKNIDNPNIKDKISGLGLKDRIAIKNLGLLKISMISYQPLIDKNGNLLDEHISIYCEGEAI